MPSLETKSRRIYLLIIYIDDILIVGVKTMIEDTVTKLRKSFSIKEVQSLDDYFGIRIIRSKDCHKAWPGQPTILTSQEKMFGEDVEKCRTH